MTEEDIELEIDDQMREAAYDEIIDKLSIGAIHQIMDHLDPEDTVTRELFERLLSQKASQMN